MQFLHKSKVKKSISLPNTFHFRNFGNFTVLSLHPVQETFPTFIPLAFRAGKFQM